MRSVAKRFKLDPVIVGRALERLSKGDPIPYLARYQREAVGGLDEETLRDLRFEARRSRELEQRREFILRALSERDDVPEKLRKRLERTHDLLELENLYLPFRPSRRTRGSIATERGLKPLADALLSTGDLDPAAAAADYANAEAGVATPDDALTGARDILAERFADDAGVRMYMTRLIQKEGVLTTAPPSGRPDIGGRYSQFKAYEERIARVPSHRYLALKRAEKEGALSVRVSFPEEKVLDDIATRHFPKECGEALRAQLEAAATDSVKRLLTSPVTADVLAALKRRADGEAIVVFSRNLYDLLLSSPSGPRRVMGFDPSPRGAVHIACIDERGQPLAHAKIRPYAKDEEKLVQARAEVVQLVTTHRVEIVALGNGQGRHDCASFLQDALDPLGDEAPPVVVVNEVGVRTYAAGPVGRAELPAFPVPARAAISLGRRLIDPLSELMKVDARQIGVGQYQNDVDPARLHDALGEVVEHSVNYVGVDVNRAPVQLLARVCGFTTPRARAVVDHRSRAGPFPNLDALKQLPVMTPAAFDQAAGFLRIRGGDQPLDATGVHPNDYPVVDRIAQSLSTEPKNLIGNADPLGGIEADNFTDSERGAAAVAGVLFELLEGGRDPRSPGRGRAASSGPEWPAGRVEFAAWKAPWRSGAESPGPPIVIEDTRADPGGRRGPISWPAAGCRR